MPIKELIARSQLALDPAGWKNPSNEGPKMQSAAQLSEVEGIRNAVKHCGFDLSPELLAHLMRKASFYGVNGYVVAAGINRALAKVRRTPSAKPESDRWVLKVVENYLADKHPRGRARHAP